MSWLMATIYDGMMRGSEEACLGAWRKELLGELSGAVLEIGAGTGSTLGLYPKAVTRLVMCEPDPHMRKKLQAKAGKVEVASFSIEDLPFKGDTPAAHFMRPRSHGSPQ